VIRIIVDRVTGLSHGVAQRHRVTIHGQCVPYGYTWMSNIAPQRESRDWQENRFVWREVHSQRVWSWQEHFTRSINTRTGLLL